MPVPACPPPTVRPIFEGQAPDWSLMLEKWRFGLGVGQSIWPMATDRIRQSLRDEIVEKVKLFAEFKAGWFGGESYEIPQKTIDRVIAVAHSLQLVEGIPNPELTPNVNGTISLEWESTRGEAYLEYGKTRISGFVRVEDYPTQYITDVKSLPISFFSRLRDQLFPLSQSYSITMNGAGPYSYAPTTTLEPAEIAFLAD
jgi:hypothetical protein